LDDHWFDEITRALAIGTSRRRLMRGVGAAAVATLLGRAGVAGAQSAQTASEKEAEKASKHLAKCQKNLDKCGSKETYLKCAECTAEVEAECSGLLGPDLAAGTCLCTSHAYCTDENGCTLDVCGPESGQCFHLPITGACIECEDDEQCPNGGACCEGRCCAAGATCQPGPGDVGICCITCEPGGAGCCDTVSVDEPGCFGPGCGVVQVVIDDATCFYGEGACAGCPAICPPIGNCWYEEVEPGHGGVVCPGGGTCGAVCVAPIVVYR